MHVCFIRYVSIATTYLLCENSCADGVNYDKGACRYYSDAYFDNECHNSLYYSQNNTMCDVAPGAFASDDAAKTWKIVLGTIMGAVGLVILASVIRQWYRSKMTPEQLDAEDAEKERKRLEKQTKQNPGDRYMSPTESSPYSPNQRAQRMSQSNAASTQSTVAPAAFTPAFVGTRVELPVEEGKIN